MILLYINLVTMVYMKLRWNISGILQAIKRKFTQKTLPVTVTKVVYLTFSLSVAIGAAVCVLLAFITCMSHVCCSSYIRSDRSAILCNITIAIILCIVVFAGGVFISYMELVPASISSYFCFAILGSLQVFGTAFFGWIFAESIHLYFSTMAVIDKGHGHLTLFYLIGWGIPFFILAGTGVLVYFNIFKLQSRCVLHVSFYLAGILVGAPCVLFIIATIIVYIMVSFSMRKNKDLLSVKIITHTKRAILCSAGLIFIHIAVLMAATAYLHFNTNQLYHYILGGMLIVEGIYLVLYHCFFDRRSVQSNSRQNSKKRDSYSTKETVTYSPNNTVEANEEETNTPRSSEKKYLIKRSSKRMSGEPSKPSPPLLRTQSSSQDALEWENSYVGMYGGSSPNNTGPHEKKPLLNKQAGDDPPETIYEEEDDNASLPTFGHGNISRTNSVPSSRHNSLPRKKPTIWDDIEDGRKQRSNSKASSIVSIETYTSSTGQPGLPVYFPSAPPHYEMSLQDTKQSQLDHIDSYLDDDSVETSRPTSFGIDSDRMSNISSELSNILFELQAFDTKRHPSETHDTVYRETNSRTLPSRREEGIDLTRQESSTFKPKRAYAKTEVTAKPQYTDNNRVRILRGRSRAEADPSDGLHHNNSDSMYSSL